MQHPRLYPRLDTLLIFPLRTPQLLLKYPRGRELKYFFEGLWIVCELTLIPHMLIEYHRWISQLPWDSPLLFCNFCVLVYHLKSIKISILILYTSGIIWFWKYGFSLLCKYSITIAKPFKHFLGFLQSKIKPNERKEIGSPF